MLGVFHQTTGINGVTFFSNEIFKDGDEGNSAERKARIGTLLFGIATLLGSIISIGFFNTFNRRTFFIGSAGLMMIFLFF